MNINLIKFQILEELFKYKKITAVAEALNLKQPLAAQTLLDPELLEKSSLFFMVKNLALETSL